MEAVRENVGEAVDVLLKELVTVGTLVPVSVGLALGGVGDRLLVTEDSDNDRCVAVTVEAEMLHEEVQV